MLEDASRMTRHTLMNWIKKKGKFLCASGIYAEFDQKYNQLLSTDQRVLDRDKVLLFLMAMDASNHLDKRWQWLEEVDVESPQPWRRTVPATIEATKPINNADKKSIKESIMEEL
jgi:hypothetical protein